ncbi:unnamed protein product [Protopolystoma xenopodis]|uniref:Uncharacterized protein n=1 Tax=Protopolystoma xenopodis TaxID=117903 RepID=A0A448WBT0_9PLAT|nr:unnamed protein product [Protopolystoma xenopodis]
MLQPNASLTPRHTPPLIPESLDISVSKAVQRGTSSNGNSTSLAPQSTKKLTSCSSDICKLMGKKSQLPSTAVSSSSGTRVAPAVSDRLPCQLAYAPSTVDTMLDWLIHQQLSQAACLQANNKKVCHDHQNIEKPMDISSSSKSSPSLSPIADCPLGPAISVYLMLRAICRQCDRWETIEKKQQKQKSREVINTTSGAGEETRSGSGVEATTSTNQDTEAVRPNVFAYFILYCKT